MLLGRSVGRRPGFVSQRGDAYSAETRIRQDFWAEIQSLSWLPHADLIPLVSQNRARQLEILALQWIRSNLSDEEALSCTRLTVLTPFVNVVAGTRGSADRRGDEPATTFSVVASL